jgi:serine/threonine protein kinase
MVETSSKLPNGIILGDRYVIIKQIGQGGFGRTYLAEDTHRYREKCVLKEFAPLVETEADLQKAEELFEREAGILYQLKHDRIPQFKALLRTQVNRKQLLFLVQEYIEGKTYYDLLHESGKFSEAEVTNLIIELLPVLDYIHQENLIHRDISPDNLIYRRADNKPVLIDFGCVKLAANAVSRSQGFSVTLIGKKGYAPEEQMRSGSAFPNSEFYALAATVVVLLTGKTPDSLYDSYQGKWLWEQETKVSSHLAQVINKMLAYNPRDRYQNTVEIAEAFNSYHPSLVNVCISRIKTLVVAPKKRFSDRNYSANNGQSRLQLHQNHRQISYLESKPTQQFTRQIQKVQSQISQVKTQAIAVSKNVSKAVSSQVKKLPYARQIRPWQWSAIAISVLIIPGIITFYAIQNLEKIVSFFKIPSHLIALQERHQQQNIYQRVQALNMNSGVFFAQVDREFYRQYPEMKNVALTDKVEHHQYRQIWYQIAEKLLLQYKN